MTSSDVLFQRIAHSRSLNFLSAQCLNVISGTTEAHFRLKRMAALLGTLSLQLGTRNVAVTDHRSAVGSRTKLGPNSQSLGLKNFHTALSKLELRLSTSSPRRFLI